MDAQSLEVLHTPGHTPDSISLKLGSSRAGSRGMGTSALNPKPRTLHTNPKP